MTKKLYDEDSHLSGFEAVVLSCVPAGEYWHVVLDRTAFFPEGGGQSADTGVLDDVHVLDVQEVQGEILHTTDAPLRAGALVQGELDWPKRFRRGRERKDVSCASALPEGWSDP